MPGTIGQGRARAIETDTERKTERKGIREGEKTILGDLDYGSQSKVFSKPILRRDYSLI